MSAVVLSGQRVPNRLEAGKFPPAHFDATSSADTMALACALHVMLKMLTTSFVVMKVHQALRCPLAFLRIDKVPAELFTKTDVIAATAPLEVFAFGFLSQPLIATTPRYLT